MKSYFSLRASFMLFVLVTLFSQFANAVVVVEDDEDVIKRSIIYDKKTPDVFYCPQEKHNGMNNMLVKSKPLNKLCEYQGQELPEGYKSDCYGNVDETVWACKEKRRILKRKYPDGMEILEKYIPLSRTKRAEYYELAHPRKTRNPQVVTSTSQSSSISSSRTKTVTEMRGMKF